MRFIRSTKTITPIQPNGKFIVYMLGYGGRMWQAKRHFDLLRDQGYTIVAMDFVDILKSGNPGDLVALMDEADDLLQSGGLIGPDTIMVGVSLGGLVGFNMTKRHPVLNKLLVITGGDMTHIPTQRALKNLWKLTQPELAALWQNVNIYSPIGAVQGRHIRMVLPKRDKIIDPDEVVREFDRHAGLNDFQLIRTNGGHFRTIITETILRPRSSLALIRELEQY